ncbi:MAG: helicase-related protein [Patescibacteria group bacterium]|nr:helicase-related protein [Patescibacteria group bacterium]
MVNLQAILIVGITPYFLEKDNLWFEQNMKKILEARKTQSFFEDNTLYLKRGQNYNFSQFLRKLDEMGYEKVLQISEPGEFSQRGGIIDVFPINLNYAIRFDFLGNEIENIEQLPVTIGNEKLAKEILKKKLKSQKLFSDLKGLKIGDYLVHLDHGIGIYNQQLIIDNQKYYQLTYAANDKLYVPVGLERKLSRYIGFVEPKISRLGSSLWQRVKRKVKEEAEKLAKELLEIYAQREVATRPPYLPEDELDLKLASSFPYEETPDQIKTIEDIKRDLENNRPMDRLLCGDVGFGKTEVALRTMIKAVKSGYQAAMICPTTILANQHFQNFRERLKNLPIKIAILSRLQPKREQKEIIERLSRGDIDIAIGTHRLLSKDVKFKKLGLLVIDDEQRFGVRQKEKLKKMRSSLDVLSLSATPIPRTLYLALSSLKNISLIQTPPVGRLPVKTFILPFSEKIIKKVIEEEIKRGGQVYYLHNRVETIEGAKFFLEKLVPKIKLGVVHGRLKEKELVKVMTDFQNKKIDVLVATTIIENGLDFPNVNTLIVADATRLGLSQAYQIRGRIGRFHVQAFAYFLYSKRLSEKANIRLKALKEAEELGSGYKIALKDLEIRGAGNILGKEQSGNINQVGLNLYCQMLSEAIEKLKRT